jgi:hypothetical protein
MDMQTMYASVDKLANTVTHQQQGMGVARAIQGDVQARQDLEKHHAVSDIGEGKEAVAGINKDGRGGGGVFSDQGELSRQRNAQGASDADEEDALPGKGPQDYRLGRHVDVSG